MELHIGPIQFKKVQQSIRYKCLLVVGSLREDFRINLDFRETAHPPLPKANINTYFSLRAKC